MLCGKLFKEPNLSTRKSESTDILLSLVMLCSSARRNFPLSSSSLFTRFFHSNATFSACASLAKISSFSFFDASTCRFESWHRRHSITSVMKSQGKLSFWNIYRSRMFPVHKTAKPELLNVVSSYLGGFIGRHTSRENFNGFRCKALYNGLSSYVTTKSWKSSFTMT